MDQTLVDILEIKGKKYYICKTCAYKTDCKNNMHIHFNGVHKSELRDRITWHPDRGYDCILHKNHFNFDDGKNLRLHLHYFHRHES